MGTTANFIANWTSSHPERVQLHKNQPELLLRWINEAQLRFADKSQILKSVWTPTIDSTGVVELPDDFLREIPDMVKWDENTRLIKGDYSELALGTFSSTLYYAIWGNNFYVFTEASGTPEIPYIIKPDTLTLTAINTSDLDIPSQYHLDLLLFMDAMWLRMTGGNSYALMEEFERKAERCGVKEGLRRNAFPMMRGGTL